VDYANGSIFLKLKLMGFHMDRYIMELGMMVLPEVRCSGGKLVAHSDLCLRIGSRKNTSKEISLNIRT
jgi:hypothetical protein